MMIFGVLFSLGLYYLLSFLDTQSTTSLFSMIKKHMFWQKRLSCVSKS
jgi:hypothetical protein